MPHAIKRKNLENVLKKLNKVVRNNESLQALRCIKIQRDGSVINPHYMEPLCARSERPL